MVRERLVALRMVFELVTPDDPQARPRPPVYPNPASDVATIRLPSATTGSVTVTVFDLVGREQIRLDWNGESGTRLIEIPTGRLAPGVYRYRIDLADESVGGSLVIVR